MTNFSLISLLLYVTASLSEEEGGGGGSEREGGAVWAARLLTSFIAALHCQRYLYLLNTACFQEATHSSYVIKAESDTVGEIFVSC